MRKIDYDAWAARYDDSRGVSESVLRPLLAALGPAHRRSLLDIGCGTGNVAHRLAGSGFTVTLCDFSPEMALRAHLKLPDAACAVADAQRLPFRDRSFDCAVSVKVLNHVPDWRRMLAGTRRVLREGPLVLTQATRETILGNWICEYLPSLPAEARFHDEAEIEQGLREAGFARVRVDRIHYRDLDDGSAQALKHSPEAFLERVTNTSLFRNLEPADIPPLLERIRGDHESGRLAEVISRYEPLSRRYGDGSMFVANP